MEPYSKIVCSYILSNFSGFLRLSEYALNVELQLVLVRTLEKKKTILSHRYKTCFQAK